MTSFDVDQINQRGLNPYAELIGIEFTKCADGKCSARLDVRAELLHGGGVVHGGAAFSLADSAMAHALMSALEPRENCSTVEIKTSYFTAVTEGEMRCDACLVKRGRRIAFLEAKVYNEGQLVGAASATFAIIGAE